MIQKSTVHEKNPKQILINHFFYYNTNETLLLIFECLCNKEWTPLCEKSWVIIGYLFVTDCAKVVKCYIIKIIVLEEVEMSLQIAGYSKAAQASEVVSQATFVSCFWTWECAISANTA